MDIAVAKMSSKGQIVIPSEMRKDIKEGDKLVIMKNGKQLIMKKAEEFSPTLEEDLEFAKRTEKAWKEFDKGRFVSMPMDKFLEELSKW